MIHIEHIKKSYKDKIILKNINLDGKASECIGIVGANGCGKSTLLNILAGSLKPDRGIILYGGRDALNKAHIFKKMCGFIPQDNPLLEDLSAKDNLRFYFAQSEYTLQEDLESGFSHILGISEFLHKKVKVLSGGQKRRLAFACALANRPKVLILDEPSVALDMVMKENIRFYLETYLKQGGTIILTTHEEAELSLCTSLYLLKDGELTPLPTDISAKELTKKML